ncbi:FxSxx-COOH system tetratricopeptide repeat protein [Streptomyces bohaiensis]|uniref:FxSxx-COOH system tetratricopeptide repeat protein n=1 Tax=Streptomyces bohaiensis TaxID=1431344 RepID=UPI003B80D73B
MLSGGGGSGKTQLAAAYAREALTPKPDTQQTTASAAGEAGADVAGADLVVWATAAEEQAVITTYAQAARKVQAPGATGEDPETDAQVFLQWLATTDRSWLVVLDNITDAAHVQRWWPQGPTGWTLATTRVHLTGGGRTRIPIDVYTPEEALTYLHQRLTREGYAHLYDQQAAKDVITELGQLPLALGFAAAYMIGQDTTCDEYLHHLTNQQLLGALPDWADAENYGRPLATALLLNLHAAIDAGPPSIVEPALHLTALLDPDGHPQELWTAEIVRGFLSVFRGPDGEPVSEQEAREAVTVLHRYGLIDRNRANGPTAVRIHALTARAVRETTPASAQAHLATTAADALDDIWPEIDQPHRDLATVLRANTDTLNAHTQHHLWNPAPDGDGAHSVLFRAGKSLNDAGLHTPAITYWQTLHHTAERLLGTDHPHTLKARHNLAGSYREAGRTGEAIELGERVLVDRARILGENHPDTLAARGNLALFYGAAGRTGEAIGLEERVLADSERTLGTHHPSTITVRGNLACSYWEAGRTGEAIELEERVLADRARILGENHPDTLAARGNLALFYGAAGRTGEAIGLKERVLADSERTLGTHHPDTLQARGSLAASYREAGRTGEAIDLQERVLADSERTLGTHHPHTLTARHNLATSYRDAGRTGEAISLEERVLADSERTLGTHHPHTLTARGNLALFYGAAGRTTEAIDLEERVLADRERTLGTHHPHTLTARHNLATSYQSAGRTGEAISLQERVLADSERTLGTDHPDTLAARGNLALFYGAAGRTTEAIDLEERVLADRERTLGTDHPDTLQARGNLAASYREAGRTTEAINRGERVLADRERTLGTDHPDTQAVREVLERWRGEAE